MFAPPVPVTWTVYVPGVAEEKLTVEVAEPPAVRVMLEGLSETLRPDGVEVEFRLIVPAKSFVVVLPML